MAYIKALLRPTLHQLLRRQAARTASRVGAITDREFGDSGYKVLHLEALDCIILVYAS
jgi:hypothetical protein